MAWPFDLVPPQSGPMIGVPPQPAKRPGVVVYRADPGTREFVMPPDSATAGNSLQDRITQVLQRAQLMEDQGGTPDNSPQLRSLVLQHDALQNALSQQMQGQAEQSKADVEGKRLAWQMSPDGQKFMLLSHPESIPLDPTGAHAAGIFQPPEARLGQYGVKPGMPLADALKVIKGMGRQIVPGDPVHSALSATYPNEIASAQFGKPTGVMDTVLHGGAGGRETGSLVGSVLGLPVQSPPVPNPAVNPLAGGLQGVLDRAQKMQPAMNQRMNPANPTPTVHPPFLQEPGVQKAGEFLRSFDWTGQAQRARSPEEVAKLRALGGVGPSSAAGVGLAQKLKKKGIGIYKGIGDSANRPRVGDRQAERQREFRGVEQGLNPFLGRTYE